MRPRAVRGRRPRHGRGAEQVGVQHAPPQGRVGPEEGRALGRAGGVHQQVAGRERRQLTGVPAVQTFDTSTSSVEVITAEIFTALGLR